MSNVNALISINLNQVDSFLDNWRFDTDGNRLANDFAPFNSPNERSPTIDVYNINDCSVPLTTQGAWRINDSGAQNKQLVTISVADIVELDWSDPEDPDPGNVLTVLSYLRETFSGGLGILEAFAQSGYRHGLVVIPPTYDENGNEVTPETTTGQPTYPANPQADTLQYMPDDVDENGENPTPATAEKEVNHFLGMTDRKWT